MPVAGEDFRVDREIQGKVVILTLKYDPESLLPQDASVRLSEKLVEKYEEAAKEGGPDCLVIIEATSAGSSLVKGLFDLYKRVNSRRGRLICSGYPKDYLGTISSLGLPKLEGFKLAYNRDEALQQLGTA